MQGLFGWQDYVLSRRDSSTAARALPEGVSIENAMSAFGLTGLTAYFGLTEVGRPKSGETVVVIGRRRGHGLHGLPNRSAPRVPGNGIAGGPEKCRYLIEELKVNAAVDYRSEDLTARLSVLCPKGVDVFFDNVGGPALDAALANLALHGRVVLCGAIARYSDTSLAPGPAHYMNLISRRGRMEGFIILDYFHRAPEALSRLGAWLKSGEIVDRVDVVVGLEHAPEALSRLFESKNRGKQLVKVADPDPAPTRLTGRPPAPMSSAALPPRPASHPRGHEVAAAQGESVRSRGEIAGMEGRAILHLRLREPETAEISGRAPRARTRRGAARRWPRPGRQRPLAPPAPLDRSFPASRSRR